jgi:hypothetical protein
MNLQQQVQKQGPLQIGRYQSWLEDGKLKLYSHQFGKANGVSCTFSPEETKALLEMLANYRDDIDSALHARERKYSLD